MKKHPALKFILILLVSAACGFLFARVVNSQESALAAISQGITQFLTQYNVRLHIGVCLGLSLAGLAITGEIKKTVEGSIGSEDEIYEATEKRCNRAISVIAWARICNFFGFSLCCVYGDPTAILISGGAMIFFLCLNTWGEVRHINVIKALESRFQNADPMSAKFQTDWEKTSDEAEKYMMYRAGFRSYQMMGRTIIAAFTVCLIVQMFTPIGILPFLVLSVLWAVHTFTYIKGCRESK